MIKALNLRLPEGFDRDLKLLMGSMTFRRVAMGFLHVVRPIYFALLGFSPVKIGLLLSIATLVSAFHSIIFGFLSDRYGRKIFLLLGGVFASLRLIIFAVSTDFWLLALGQGMGALGEGAGAGQPVVSGYISDKTDIMTRPGIFSGLATSNALASTLGYLLAALPAFFQTSIGMDVVGAHALLFWIGTASTLIGILLLIPIRDTKAQKPVDESPREASGRRESWGIIIKFSLVRSTSGIGWGFIQSLLSLYFFIRFGVGGEVLGPIYAATRLLSVFSYGFIPSVVDRFGEIPSLVGSRIVTAALTIGFSLSPSYLLALFFMVALRISIMFTMPIRQSFATTIVDPEETATAIGISSFARMSLRTVAPVIAGYMFETISLSLPFMIGALFIAANGLLYKSFFQPEKEDLED
ncbi:MAG: MFS transporter [Candidatus Bathyarchaeota archaeon]